LIKANGEYALGIGYSTGKPIQVLLGVIESLSAHRVIPVYFLHVEKRKYKLAIFRDWDEGELRVLAMILKEKGYEVKGLTKCDWRGISISADLYHVEEKAVTLIGVIKEVKKKEELALIRPENFYC